MKIFPTAVNPLGKAQPAYPNEGLEEPSTYRYDRRNYVCDKCGRDWRRFGNRWRCPYCGYAREKARP